MLSDPRRLLRAIGPIPADGPGLDCRDCDFLLPKTPGHKLPVMARGVTSSFTDGAVRVVMQHEEFVVCPALPSRLRRASDLA